MSGGGNSGNDMFSRRGQQGGGAGFGKNQNFGNDGSNFGGNGGNFGNSQGMNR